MEKVTILRVAMISDGLHPPYDEGFKNFAFEFSKGLETLPDVYAFRIPISRGETLVSRKLFLSARLRNQLRRERPHVIFYLPTSSATPMSLLRTRILNRYGRCPIVLLCLQPRRYSGVTKRLLPLLRPELLLVPGGNIASWARAHGFLVRVIPAGIELQRFRPVRHEEKSALRSKYGLPEAARLVLHVGHLTPTRNLRILVRLREELHCEVALVGSTAFGYDRALRDELVRKGVHVFTDYMPKIEEIYACADCYVFPVTQPGASIGTPLSVLEAMATNLPVVTTPFGGLQDLFQEDPQAGFFFAKCEDDMVERVRQALRVARPDTRRMVANLSWRRAAKEAVKATREALAL